MNKSEWKSIAAKTKWASRKKYLTKKERGNLMQAQITLGRMKPKEQVDESFTFKEKPKEPKSIKDILGLPTPH